MSRTETTFCTGDGITGPSVLRLAKLTVDASPEPVVKGRTITVTGRVFNCWEFG